ncbi:MAG: Na+/H+ antiporter subunit E, partial [Candidatus Omnitrophica bacterium]|nr:Na+/H+ antiporter subunit E [Candidatus Omnitrophota bacterium]
PDARLKINIVQIFPFFLFFIHQSILGGWDVIRRAFHPSCPLAPGFIKYQLKVQDPTAQVFFANAISLLPGTFSADLDERSIAIHVLDETLPNVQSLKNLERKVAALFGEGIADA